MVRERRWALSTLAPGANGEEADSPRGPFRAAGRSCYSRGMDTINIRQLAEQVYASVAEVRAAGRSVIAVSVAENHLNKFNPLNAGGVLNLLLEFRDSWTFTVADLEARLNQNYVRDGVVAPWLDLGMAWNELNAMATNDLRKQLVGWGMQQDWIDRFLGSFFILIVPREP